MATDLWTKSVRDKKNTNSTSTEDVQEEAQLHSLPMAPTGSANKPRHTVHKPQINAKQNSQLPLPQHSYHDARQVALKTTTKRTNM